MAGPFFTTGQIWVVEELLSAIERLGASVFSPLHDVGTQQQSEIIANLDLEGIKSSQAMLAVLDGSDPGTLFEIGYARSQNIPVVVLAENVMTSELTMMLGTGCEIVDDCRVPFRVGRLPMKLLLFSGGIDCLPLHIGKGRML